MLKENNQIREYVVNTLNRYWLENTAAILYLPIPKTYITISDNHELSLITLPDWAADVGISNQLLVPSHCIVDKNEKNYLTVDWFNAAFHLMNATDEQVFEQNNKPIHSYSYRLSKFAPLKWQYAWVNRIALFLRRWAAQQQNKNELSLFGELPKPNIVITHDVDAIRKTNAIRFKQTAFNGFNAAKCLLNRDLNSTKKKLFNCRDFLFSNDNYNRIPELLELERQYNISANYHFYSWPSFAKKTMKEKIFDPGYYLSDVSIFSQILNSGHQIGLHQSFNAWRDSDLMLAQKQNLEKSFGMTINSCRQHWLRFSWQDTWKAQIHSEFKLDYTLAFNDRSGFRNSCAIAIQPWLLNEDAPLPIKIIPTILMDSHCYDYNLFDDAKRRTNMFHWINEIKQVGGEAAVLWHPHTLGHDYNWKNGFIELLDIIKQ